MGHAIIRPETAFQLSTGKKKRPRDHDKDYLDFIRGLPCLVCLKRGVEAAHVRYGDWRYGKRDTGGQEKPSDKWSLPLCSEHHKAQHNDNERAWWEAQGIDPLLVATLLFSAREDEERAEAIIRTAKGGKTERREP